MKNRKTGTAIPFRVVTLDKPRRLRLGMGTIIEFEQLTGQKVMDINKDTEFVTIAQLLWVMMKREEKDMTFEEAIDIVDEYGGDLTEIMSIVGEVIGIAFGEKEEKKLEVLPETTPEN